MDTDRIADTFLAAAVRAAIASRLNDRRWYRILARMDPARFAGWADLALENDVKLRELIAVSRSARKLARPAIEREDAITRAKAEAYRGDHHVGVGR